MASVGISEARGSIGLRYKDIWRHSKWRGHRRRGAVLCVFPPCGGARQVFPPRFYVKMRRPRTLWAPMPRRSGRHRRRLGFTPGAWRNRPTSRFSRSISTQLAGLWRGTPPRTGPVKAHRRKGPQAGRTGGVLAALCLLGLLACLRAVLCLLACLLTCLLAGLLAGRL